jgi:Protein of unknown function (DUF3040)
MLGEAEQRRLTEIERELRTTDPQFVQRFDIDIQPGPRKRHRITARGWLIVAALLMGLAVLTARLEMAVIALSVAGVSACWWFSSGRHRSGNERR